MSIENPKEEIVQTLLTDLYTLPNYPFANTAHDKNIHILTESIRAEGIRVPVKLLRREEGGYYVVEGVRRCKAAIMADMKTIPAVIQKGNVQDYLKNMINSNAGYIDQITKAPPINLFTAIKQRLKLAVAKHKQRSKNDGHKR